MNRFSFALRTTRWPSSEEESELPAWRYFEGPASESEEELEDDEDPEDDPDFEDPDDELLESESLPELSSPPQNLELCGVEREGTGGGCLVSGWKGEVYTLQTRPARVPKWTMEKPLQSTPTFMICHRAPATLRHDGDDHGSNPECVWLTHPRLCRAIRVDRTGIPRLSTSRADDLRSLQYRRWHRGFVAVKTRNYCVIAGVHPCPYDATHFETTD